MGCFDCNDIPKYDFDNESIDKNIDDQIIFMIILRIIIILLNGFKLFILLEDYSFFSCVNESFGYIIFTMSIHLIIVFVKLSTFFYRGKLRKYIYVSRKMIFMISNIINFTTLRWVNFYNDISLEYTTCNIIIHFINIFISMIDISLFFNTLQLLNLIYIIVMQKIY